MFVEDFKHEEQKTCKQCNRFLPNSFQKDICPVCEEMNMFSEVKDYIRNNTVRENDVAEHFNIPVSKVRKWIREGRIEYKQEKGADSYTGMFCKVCGEPIAFGSICPECRKLKQKQAIPGIAHEDNIQKMHFISDNK